MGGRSFDQQSELEIVPDPDLRRGWIGAALSEAPYWTLLDVEGRPWGRLCLWFDDEEHATSQVGHQLRSHFEQSLRHGVVRRLRNVDVAADANVVRVRHNPLLVLQLEKVTRGAGGDVAPVALLGQDFDVARVSEQRYPRQYELAVVREHALERDLVNCSPGKALVFGTS